MDIEPAKGKSRNHGFLTADYTDTPYPCNPCNPRLTSVADLPRCTAISRFARRRRRFNAETQRAAESSSSLRFSAFLCTAIDYIVRSPERNFALSCSSTSDFGFRISAFFRPSTFDLRISGSAGLCLCVKPDLVLVAAWPRCVFALNAVLGLIQRLVAAPGGSEGLAWASATIRFLRASA